MTIGLGFISWRGIPRHMEVQMTVTHGLEPAKATINIPPNDGDIGLGGTLLFQQGSTVIPFFDCRADLVDVYKDSNELEMWTVTILDRRWKWKFGQISGYYNVRVDKTIRAGTERNIKQLMRLCLEAMGESNYDLSTVPTNIFPEVEWNYTLPAEALSRLADTIGYRVVFQIRRNRVAILKGGVGRQLAQQNATNYAATFDPPEAPTELRFAGSRTLWELDLPLEAVVEEVDHSVKLLNDPTLSYRPRGPGFFLEGIRSYWSEYDDEMGNIIGNQNISLVSGITSIRKFAQSQVYRKYRIMPARINNSSVGPQVRPLFLPHPEGRLQVQRVDQLLPLLRERLATYPTEFGQRPKPAVIWGKFEGYSAAKQNNIDDTPRASSSGGEAELPDGSPPKNLVYPDGWNLDAETGIVTFDKAVRRFIYQTYLVPSPRGAYEQDYCFSLPAIMWLRTSFGFRDNTTLGWKSWEIRRQMDSTAHTNPQYVRRDDVPLSICVGSRGNEFPIKDAGYRDYSKAAKFYLDEVAKAIEVRDPVAVTYPTLRLEELDGAIQQVTFMITKNGAFTKVSRNREEPIVGYSYADQRLFQQVSARLKDATTARSEADKADRKPGRG